MSTTNFQGADGKICYNTFEITILKEEAMKVHNQEKNLLKGTLIINVCCSSNQNSKCVLPDSLSKYCWRCRFLYIPASISFLRNSSCLIDIWISYSHFEIICRGNGERRAKECEAIVYSCPRFFY